MSHHSNIDIYSKYDKLVKVVVDRLLLSRNISSLCVEKDDLFQIAWITLINCLDKFDPTRNIKFETYASKAMINSINTELLKQSKKKLSPLYVDIEEDAKEDSNIIFKQIISVSNKVLSRKQRDVFWKKFIDNLTFTDIGSQMGFSRETARKIYNKSFKIIKESINE